MSNNPYKLVDIDAVSDHDATLAFDKLAIEFGNDTFEIESCEERRTRLADETNSTLMHREVIKGPDLSNGQELQITYDMTIE